MTRINLNLKDGFPPISFNLELQDAERFCRFWDECNQAQKENEIMKKQLDGLRDQIMNLPCVVPVQLMTRNDIQIYGWGYVTARKEAAELAAGIKAGKDWSSHD